MILYTLHGNGYIDIGDLESRKDISVYVNLTNRCPCACTFCLRQTKEMSEANTLWLQNEPTVTQIIDEFQKYDLNDFSEVVFCGFGEPLVRFDDVMAVAAYLKSQCPHLPIRVNTNGLANLIHDKDVTPMLKDRIDIVSISLNAPDKDEYLALTRSTFGIQSFDAMLDFAKKSKQYVSKVILSVVDVIGDEKIQKCQKICDDLDVSLRVRPFEV